ncbi:hypothetical protein HDU76_003205 [Blyttiomyces sp. JEL0837]|nr:hypothetical protein HDU76_003205 [Blyttiomyces sp. JEL0837]
MPSCQVSGPLPSFLGSLPLKYIDLSGNSMNGALPASIGNLGSLNTLNLNGTAFSGTVPASYANLGSLNKLDLGNNCLTGGLPGNLGSKFTMGTQGGANCNPQQSTTNVPFTTSTRTSTPNNPPPPPTTNGQSTATTQQPPQSTSTNVPIQTTTTPIIIPATTASITTTDANGNTITSIATEFKTTQVIVTTDSSGKTFTTSTTFLAILTPGSGPGVNGGQGSGNGGDGGNGGGNGNQNGDGRTGSSSSGSNMIPIVAGGVGGFLVILAVVVFGIFMVKKRNGSRRGFGDSTSGVDGLSDQGNYKGSLPRGGMVVGVPPRYQADPESSIPDSGPNSDNNMSSSSSLPSNPSPNSNNFNTTGSNSSNNPLVAPPRSASTMNRYSFNSSAEGVNNNRGSYLGGSSITSGNESSIDDGQTVVAPRPDIPFPNTFDPKNSNTVKGVPPLYTSNSVYNNSSNKDVKPRHTLNPGAGSYIGFDDLVLATSLKAKMEAERERELDHGMGIGMDGIRNSMDQLRMEEVSLDERVDVDHAGRLPTYRF